MKLIYALAVTLCLASTGCGSIQQPTTYTGEVAYVESYLNGARYMAYTLKSSGHISEPTAVVVHSNIGKAQEAIKDAKKASACQDDVTAYAKLKYAKDMLVSIRAMLPQTVPSMPPAVQ